jgi:RNA polymerase sigma factor (sigma-70 family)
MTKEKILWLLREGDHERAFRALYKQFPKVRKHIVANSGRTAEAHDIFQEALIILFNKAYSGELKDEVDPYGFVHNTSKFLWNNQLRKKKGQLKNDTIDTTDLEYQDEIEDAWRKEEKLMIIEDVLQSLGQKCKKILELFYFKSLSMDSIARKVGFSTVKSAKTQKYKCLERARKLALENLEMSNELNELS